MYVVVIPWLSASVGAPVKTKNHPFQYVVAASEVSLSFVLQQCPLLALGVLQSP